MKIANNTRWGILFFMLLFGFIMAGCGGSGAGSGVSHHHHFHGYDESGDRYELEVISSDQNPQNFQDGDHYILQIINNQGNNVGRSSGRVRSFIGGILTLVHQGGAVFNVHITVFITWIPNDFPLDNGTTRRSPGSLTRDRPNQPGGINQGGSGVPNVPTNVTATATSSSSITVSWPAVSGATLYKLERSTSLSGQYSVVGNISTTSFTDTGLLANTTYFYRVFAMNSFGESAPSNPVSATTSGGASTNPPDGTISSGPRLLSIADVPTAVPNLMMNSYGEGEIAIFPAGTTLEQAIAGTGMVARASGGERFGVGPYTVTAPLVNYPNRNSWTGSGTFDIFWIIFNAPAAYLYGRLEVLEAYKFESVDISSTMTYLSFNNAIPLVVR